MLLGVALLVVGAGVLYYAVSGVDPRDLLRGGPAAPTAPWSAPVTGWPGETRGPGHPIDQTQTPGSGTARIRMIVGAARAVPGWRLGRICGADTLVGSAVSEHVYCNAADLMVPSSRVGDALAGYLRSLAISGLLPIHCIIWNRRIASRPSFTWRPYSGSNPHTDHVHVSAWPSIGGAC